MAMVKEAELTRKLLDELFSSRATDDLGVRLWDGTYWPDDGTRRVTIVLNHPGALRRMLLPGNELTMGEAYLYDDFEIEGDVESLIAIAEGLSDSVSDLGSRLRLGRAALRLPRSDRRSTSKRGPAQMTGERHSIGRDRQAIAYHYNVSNNFYALLLDGRMVYSCAYFHSPEDSLDQAQEQKLNHICRKLRLSPGQRLLDIGCGWGGLVIHAAEHYGVEALGITLSEPQAILANERIAEDAGFEVRDVESLREHYAMTLRHWVRRLEANHDQALKFVDEPTYRVWRLFMSGSAYGFTTGRLNVHQALLAKPGLDGVSGLPLTRAHMYSVGFNASTDSMAEQEDVHELRSA
ncbi:MAG: class I SAM-dependent methyltransferase [Anaerolineales bacterium]